MPDISYVQSGAGDWTLLVHGDTMLAVDLRTGDPRVSRLWELVSADAPTGAVMDELISGGISAAPAFVLAGGADRAAMRVLVRGPVALTVAGAGAQLEISGEGVSSWIEQVVDASKGLSFERKTGGRRTHPLPLRSGIVSACLASTTAGSVASVEPPSEPAPVSRSQVDPEATIAGQTVSEPPSEASGYDHLFGETVYRKVEDAAVRADDDETDVDGDGDHDGHTVMVSDRAALRARRRAAKAAPAPEPEVPRLFLELSTGGREWLDQPLVIGRAPTASSVSSGSVPRLVSMNTPNQDISRTHAAVSAEGGTVVVTDLHSSNGTSITVPGKAAQRLRPGEPATVIVGTVIDLGDGATLTVCESAQ